MREIKAHTNEYIKMLKSLKLKKYRDEQGLYIVEGTKIIEEAVENGQEVECVIVSERMNAFGELMEKHGMQVIAVPYELLQQVADTKSPPKEIACIKMPKEPMHADGRFLVAMDDVNDPKNLGAVIRTADAMGADGIWVSQTSADIYGPKVQRAAMGSTFHLPVEVCELGQRIHHFHKNGGTVVAGSLQGKEELRDTYEKVCVVIGNESRGISEEIKIMAVELYRIPLYGRAESLNAGIAAGIMLYEIRNRLKG